MSLRYTRVLFVVAFALAGCSASNNEKSASSESDAGGDNPAEVTCNELYRMLEDAEQGLSVECEADADCTYQSYDPCGCPIAHRAVDDPEVESLREQLAECDSVSCNNAPVCPWGGGFGPVEGECIDSVCRAVPRPDCEALARGPFEEPAPRCATNDDCEVRSDTTACGCPTAHHVDVGAVLARAYERECPTPDECLLIDCVPATEARCDDGFCVLIE